MTEDREHHDADEVSGEAWEESAATAPVQTGVPGVDAVIAAVGELEDRPVEEHVGVFESAHEQLRRALDEQPGRPGPP